MKYIMIACLMVLAFIAGFGYSNLNSRDDFDVKIIQEAYSYSWTSDFNGGIERESISAQELILCMYRVKYGEEFDKDYILGINVDYDVVIKCVNDINESL